MSEKRKGSWKESSALPKPEKSSNKPTRNCSRSRLKSQSRSRRKREEFKSTPRRKKLLTTSRKPRKKRDSRRSKPSSSSSLIDKSLSS